MTELLRASMQYEKITHLVSWPQDVEYDDCCKLPQTLDQRLPALVPSRVLTDTPNINATCEATATGASDRWLVVSSMNLSKSLSAMVCEESADS